MRAEEQSIPTERSHGDKAIQTCLIPAPRMLLLQQLLTGSHVMKKNHENNFNGRWKLQLALT